MHEINEKNYQTKIVIRRPSKEYTKMYIFIVRSCGRWKKKNGNKEQSSRFTAAPKHLLSFIAKKPTTIEKKMGIKNKARDLQLRLNICSLSLQRNQQQYKKNIYII